MSECKEASAESCRERRWVDHWVAFPAGRPEAEVREDIWKVSKALYFEPECGWTELPEAVPENFRITQVKGGITNQLFSAHWPGPEAAADSPERVVLIRLFGKKTEIVINRARESLVVDQMSQLGFGPLVYGRFPTGRAEQYLLGASLEPQQMYDPRIAPQIARELARMHRLHILLDKAETLETVDRTPALWPQLEAWMQQLELMNFDDKPAVRQVFETLDLAAIRKNFDTLKQLLTAVVDAHPAQRTPVVFAHNDLLSGNIMYHPESGTVRFVDFEYSCYSLRAFDIANHFFEHCGFECVWEQFPDESTQRLFFSHYLSESLGVPLEQVPEDKVTFMFREVAPYVLCSHLFWGLWAVIQARHSLIDFDYIGYSTLRLGAMLREMDRFTSDLVAYSRQTAQNVELQ